MLWHISSKFSYFQICDDDVKIKDLYKGAEFLPQNTAFADSRKSSTSSKQVSWLFSTYWYQLSCTEKINFRPIGAGAFCSILNIHLYHFISSSHLTFDHNKKTLLSSNKISPNSHPTYLFNLFEIHKLHQLSLYSENVSVSLNVMLENASRKILSPCH